MKTKYPKKIKLTTSCPWGYEQIEGTREAIANDEMMETLGEGISRLENEDSLRQVVEFFKAQGHPISRPTLVKLWEEAIPDSKVRAKQKRKVKKQTRKRVIKKNSKVLTKAQLDAKKKSLAVAAERRRITAANKRLEAMLADKDKADGKVQEINLFNTKRVVEEPQHMSEEEQEEFERKPIFEANPGPQSDFLSATEKEVLFGGAAGGGKSIGLLADPIRYFDNPHFSGLLVRKTNDELRELVQKSKLLYPQIFPKGSANECKFSEKASEWRFKSGAKLWLSYLDDEKDLLRYQGQSYTWIGFDELTHWHTPGPWDYLRSRLRTSKGSGLEKHLFMRATTNPGGPGHMWVKEMFIDPAPPNTAFWATDIEKGTILTDPETEEPLHQRRFIPSRLIDNPYLWEDGQYRSNLLSLPEAQRLKLLEGDWNIVEGAAFSEFRTSVHVVKPFDIPKEWTRFRCMDWGYNAPSAVLWIAIDPSDGQLVVYREMYGNNMDAEEWAGHIRYAQRNEKVLYGVLDSSCWNKKGEGPGIAERMIMNGVTWRPSDRSPGSRIARKNRLHELLKVNEEYDRPGIVFFENCRNLIADLPMIPNDPKGTEDIDPKFPNLDHTYDALGYGIMSRPKPHTPFWIGQSTTPSVHVSDQVFGY